MTCMIVVCAVPLTYWTGADARFASMAQRTERAEPAAAPLGATANGNLLEEPDVKLPSDLALTQAQRAVLEARGWTARAGENTAVWVSISEQMLRIIRNGRIVWLARCATAANGIGSEMNSLKTPLGWHAVIEKSGAGAPWGQVFRSRKPVNQIWNPGDSTKEDLVLTRILALDGLEPGLNKGGQVDSNARNIYIHGTNAEEKIGTPSSHGCVRLANDDVIAAFDRIPQGALVLITE